MARYTNLYQSPRSPLIQGRTRWERPLWQSWAGGIAVGALVGVVIAVVRGIWQPLWLPAAAVVVGSGVGALLARSFGWRLRWVASAVLSSAAVAAVMVLFATTR